MPEFYYKDALKSGQREFRGCVSRGEYPYLAVLDDFLPAGQLSRERDLGVVQIPMEFMAGTRTSGRTNAFARNFMPLLPEGSEFAGKWERLCQTHLKEGIRDPLKVYEYLRRFYVEEGNKRVSVLKYFGAVSVPAQVIRILPEQNGSREVALYNEYVDFYRYAQVNFVEFTRPGGYARLQKLMGKGAEESWTAEDRSGLATVLHYFRKAYEECGGKRFATTVGDAFLSCAEVYGYPALRSMGAAEMKRAVERMWEEIALQQVAAPIDVKLSPVPEPERGRRIPKELLSGGPLPKSGTADEHLPAEESARDLRPKDLRPKDLLSKKLLSRPEAKTLKAAFLHDKTPELSGWTRAHEQGRWHAQQVLGGSIETKSWFEAMNGDPLAVIEEAIDQGNTVIFTTSPRLLPASLRAAVDHPEVTILNCSLNKPHRYIRTYYARMYEAKFITGAIAGVLADHGEPVGYICDYPIFGQVAGINAFALGVQMVNATSKVMLEWSSVGSAAAATDRLLGRGLRLLSALDLTGLESRDYSGLGLLMADGGSQVLLARPVWRWDVYYETLLRRIRDRSFRSEYEESGRAVNYYWGLSAGVVDVNCSRKLPDGVRRLAELLREGIRSGACDPFRGPLRDQNRRILAEEGTALGLEQIMNMDYLAENVQGAIPSYEELNDTGRATVGIVGVGPAAQGG